MTEQVKGPEITTLSEMIFTEFKLVSMNPFKFEFLGIKDEDDNFKEADQNCYPIVIGEIVTLIDGKFPLSDSSDAFYQHCDVFPKHEYTFEKENGIILKGFLDGFSINCTEDYINMILGNRVISVFLTKNK